MGIAYLPDFAIVRQLREGLLVTVLDDYTDRLWPSSRHLAPKLRVFVDFLARPEPDRTGLCQAQAPAPQSCRPNRRRGLRAIGHALDAFSPDDAPTTSKTQAIELNAITL
jgi:hypothetical protein